MLTNRWLRSVIMSSRWEAFWQAALEETKAPPYPRDISFWKYILHIFETNCQACGYFILFFHDDSYNMSAAELPFGGQYLWFPLEITYPIVWGLHLQIVSFGLILFILLAVYHDQLCHWYCKVYPGTTLSLWHSGECLMQSYLSYGIQDRLLQFPQRWVLHTPRGPFDPHRSPSSAIAYRSRLLCHSSCWRMQPCGKCCLDSGHSSVLDKNTTILAHVLVWSRKQAQMHGPPIPADPQT